MPLYLSQVAYTPDAWAALVNNPADRTGVVRGLIEQAGGSLIAFYYSLGEYDALMIAEAPDEYIISTALIAALAPGHVREMKTITLLTAAGMVDVLRQAGNLRYDGVPQSMEKQGSPALRGEALA